MLELNLLPPKEIKKIEIKYFSNFLGHFSIRIIFLLIIFLLFLLSTLFSLVIILKSQDGLIEERKNDERALFLEEIESRTIELNKSIKQIYIKQNELIFWTPILEELSKITPNGVYLTNLSYQSVVDKTTLSGFAKTRENLIIFQNNLIENDCFIDTEAPLSNLIKQSEVNFVFTFNPISCFLSEDEK